jgi:hypothetical protein
MEKVVEKLTGLFESGVWSLESRACTVSGLLFFVYGSLDGRNLTEYNLSLNQYYCRP